MNPKPIQSTGVLLPQETFRKKVLILKCFKSFFSSFYVLTDFMTLRDAMPDDWPCPMDRYPVNMVSCSISYDLFKLKKKKNCKNKTIPKLKVVK